MSTPPTTVRLENVTKCFGVQTALKEISLEIPKGEFLALLGHNGAGKSTLMKLILGLNRPTQGTVFIFGQDPTKTVGRIWRKQVGFLPENVVLHSEMTGLDTLAFYARLKEIPKKTCMTLLHQVGLSFEAAHNRVQTYSKGMRQRLGLAQALLGEPHLLLLDEPTTGLDPTLRRLFYATLQALKARGTTILLSSHILRELEPHCDRVLILREGEIAALGSLEQLRHHARLSTTVRITTNGPVDVLVSRLSPHYSVQKIHGHIVQLECPLVQKVSLLDLARHSGANLQDIEIKRPNLDDIYLHFNGNTLGAETS